MSEDFRLLQLFNQLSESDKKSVFDFTEFLVNRQSNLDQPSTEETIRETLKDFDFNL
ncbi:DUF2281 domain-containing protein [Lysinibacillus mangiferihumi]|uniref:DUF2281 domain-containing protein n=1 Tax=Lysinibacillus mangiferihumi TaxID=1130819 RepID=A0A4U2Z7B0_9BACI|nr:DUF2281 domain-containing protein [Lysinibacillus mangiferihumi]TKI70147.1 DUF2281 domain-containing protein [Lysinibacillus mangiferihumi]